jgi:AcrR family transcriptional regulator
MRSEASPSQAHALAPRGRPRSEHARNAVVAAALALVEKGGYSAATIEAIADRSGVAKTTIYRWWPNRAALVVDLLVQIAAEAAPPPAGGHPLRAIRRELRLVAAASEALPGRLLISLLGEAEHDPDIQTALLQRLFTPRRKATALVIRRAQDTGLLRRGVNPRLVGDLFYGPLFYRKFIRHESVGGAFVGQVFRQVLAGMRPEPKPRKKLRSR